MLSLAQPNNGNCPPETSSQNLLSLTCFSQSKSNSKHFFHYFHHDIMRLATFHSIMSMNEYDSSLHMLIIQYGAPHLLTKHCQNRKASLLSKLLFRHQGWVHAAFKGTHTVECQMQHLEKTCNLPLCCEDHQTNSTESRECCHWRSQTMAIARQKHLHKIYCLWHVFSKQVKQQAFLSFLSPCHHAPCHFPQHHEYEWIWFISSHAYHPIRSTSFVDKALPESESIAAFKAAVQAPRLSTCCVQRHAHRRMPDATSWKDLQFTTLLRGSSDKLHWI